MRGRKRDYNGRTGRVLRFVQAHPGWSYLQIGGHFGVTRQAIHELVTTEEKLTGVKLHTNRYNRPHIETCLVCQKAIRILRKDPAWRTADLFPGIAPVRWSYHAKRLKKAGVMDGTVFFYSKKMLTAYQAWRDGMPAAEIERRYGYRNWCGVIARLAEPCPGAGRYEARDLRPTWQKDLEGHDITRLTRFSLRGWARTEKGTGVPFQHTVYSRSKRRATLHAEEILWRTRRLRVVRLKVEKI